MSTKVSNIELCGMGSIHSIFRKENTHVEMM